MAQGISEARMGNSQSPLTGFSHPKPRTTVDVATLVGLFSSLGLIGAAIYMGGSAKAFIDIPSVLIVVLGTVAVTAISFSLSDLGTTRHVLMKTIVRTIADPAAAGNEMIKLAEVARRQGPLALQSALPALSSEPFLLRAMTLVSDGMTADDVENILQGEVDAVQARHSKAVSIVRRAADVAPAMGLIGTLVGLVQMLGNLSDPSTIGPSMAVALLTTFYGAIMSYVVLLPLAAKLDRNSGHEVLIKTVYLIGAASIARQENPRRLEMLINAVLPPTQRVRYFD